FRLVLVRVVGFFHAAEAGRRSGLLVFLSLAAIILLIVLAYRWLKVRMLWRLRNRLIVTYIFIGVIPAILLIALYFISTYLFAGQFATFVLTSELQPHLRPLPRLTSP